MRRCRVNSSLRENLRSHDSIGHLYGFSCDDTVAWLLGPFDGPGCSSDKDEPATTGSPSAAGATPVAPDGRVSSTAAEVTTGCKGVEENGTGVLYEQKDEAGDCSVSGWVWGNRGGG